MLDGTVYLGSLIKSPAEFNSRRHHRAGLTRGGYGPIATFSVLNVLEYVSAPKTPRWTRLLAIEPRSSPGALVDRIGNCLECGARSLGEHQLDKLDQVGSIPTLRTTSFVRIRHRGGTAYAIG